MKQTNPSVPQVDTSPIGQVRELSLASRFGAPARRSLWAFGLALAAVACGAPPERPGTQEVSGTRDHIVTGAAGEPSGPCEHGTVVECKVWITDVDCFTGLAVCDQGELSGCMDADAAEARLAELGSAVE